MLENAYLDAKIGIDPAENEPRKECEGTLTPGGTGTTRRMWMRTRRPGARSAANYLPFLIHADLKNSNSMQFVMLNF